MEKIDISDLYTKRLLVFIEDEDKPNEYHQVILNAEQFKKVSDAVIKGNISTKGMRQGHQQVEIIQSEKTYKLPDEFSDFE